MLIENNLDNMIYTRNKLTEKKLLREPRCHKIRDQTN